MHFPLFKQLDQKDCGPTCLRMVAKYHGKHFSLEKLRDKCYVNKYGSSLLGLSDGADEIGLRSKGVKLSVDQLYKDAPLPCILHWNENHFVVAYRRKGEKLLLADPSKGKITVNLDSIQKHWCSGIANETKGIALLLEPTPQFFAEEEDRKQHGFSFLFKYLIPYRQEISQTILTLVISTIIQLIFPFLTQSIIDFGINNQNLNFVQLIIISQLLLTLISTAIGFIQSWISLHVGAKLSISMISDFLIKLLGLPISFFNTRSIGDILQRMNDNSRVLSFITGSPLTILFSVINLVIYGAIMLFYSKTILLVFLIGNTLYTLWVIAFLKKRRQLDYEGFEKSSKARSNQIALIDNIQDIKLNNIEKEKRWEWENIQASIYKWRIKGLKIGQLQSLGALLINQSKNITMSYLAAMFVIQGEMTLGMMVAIQYMIGQLQQPFSTFVGLIQSIQDVRISLERLDEVTDKEGEEDPKKLYADKMPENGSLKLQNVTFRYEGKSSDPIIHNISFAIPQGKTTAIVGVSGSGKTTLVKLLLKLYQPESGHIKVGNIELDHIKARDWRNVCGSVMQDGAIFNDTVIRNLAVNDPFPNFQELRKCCEQANIQEFVENLPLGYQTKIGKEFLPLSQGQKQRILIARMLYKKPDYCFLDEATSSLDTKNESSIMANIKKEMHGKTLLIVAHRLSTVLNADQIIVLDKGKIAEKGTHEELVEIKGLYYSLVKNQIDI